MLKPFAAAAAGLMALGTLGVALAAPPDAETFIVDCGAESYEVWTNGSGDFTPGHIVGGRGVLVPYYFRDSGTYTPPGPGTPETFDETLEKGNGNAAKNKDLTVCTTEFAFEDPETGEAFAGTSEVGAVVRGR